MIADICVVEDAVVMVAYNSHVATRQMHEVFGSTQPILETAGQVATEFTLPETWLETLAGLYVTSARGSGGPQILEHQGVRVSADTPEHLLTLKLLSAHAGDHDDQGLRILIDVLGLTTVEQVVARASHILPAQEMDQQTTRWVARVIDA